jgi:hypothetical protein
LSSTTIVRKRGEGEREGGRENDVIYVKVEN